MSCQAECWIGEMLSDDAPDTTSETASDSRRGLANSIVKALSNAGLIFAIDLDTGLRVAAYDVVLCELESGRVDE